MDYKLCMANNECSGTRGGKRINEKINQFF